MTGLTDIEVALVQRLSMLRVGTAGAFRSIDVVEGRDLSRLLDYLRRVRNPAVVVRYLGRKGASSAKAAEFAVCVGVEDLGDGRGMGAMRGLLDLLRSNLDGTTLLTGCRLAFAAEVVVADDDRTLVFQQTYSVEEAS